MGQSASIEDIADKVQGDVNEDHDHYFIPTMFVIKGSECSEEKIKASFRTSRDLASICSNKTQIAFTCTDCGILDLIGWGFRAHGLVNMDSTKLSLS
jgi:hypothetical protein